MKNILILLACCLMSVSSFGQSQAQMNVQADAAYRKADQELNRTYQQILKEYRTQNGLPAKPESRPETLDTVSRRRNESPLPRHQLAARIRQLLPRLLFQWVGRADQSPHQAASAVAHGHPGGRTCATAR